MTGLQRALIGATGGILAVLTKYLAQDHAWVSHWANIHDPHLYDIILGYAILTPILVILGGAVAGFSDEVNKFKLLAMGVAAPALITTMGPIAQPGPAASSTPPAVNHNIGPAGWSFPLSPIGIAIAANNDFRMAEATAIQKGVEAFFGAGKGEPRFWVIVGSFRDKTAAETLVSNINEQNPSMKAFVGKRMPNNEFYPVIVGDFVTLSEATRLRDAASQLSSLNGQQPYLSSYPDRQP
jgi:SPOR domain